MTEDEGGYAKRLDEFMTCAKAVERSESVALGDEAMDLAEKADAEIDKLKARVEYLEEYFEHLKATVLYAGAENLLRDHKLSSGVRDLEWQIQLDLLKDLAKQMRVPYLRARKETAARCKAIEKEFEKRNHEHEQVQSEVPSAEEARAEGPKASPDPRGNEEASS